MRTPSRRAYNVLVYTTATPILRPLQRHERAPVLTVFRGLGERSRRRRFLGAKPRLSARELETLTDIQPGRHEAERPGQRREDVTCDFGPQWGEEKLLADQ